MGKKSFGGRVSVTLVLLRRKDKSLVMMVKSVNIMFCFQNGGRGGGGRDSVRGRRQVIFRTTGDAASYWDGNFRPGLPLSGLQTGNSGCLIFHGNFAQDKTSKDYYALKILTMAQVIKLKQVEHVINEKEILR